VLSGHPIKAYKCIKTSDEAGRWSGNIYILSSNKKIALISTCRISIYQNPGSTTINAQLVAWLANNNCLVDLIIEYQDNLSN
jgi:hypothetical protein